MVNGEILDTFLLKTRNKKLPFDPAIPLLGLHPKKPETRIRNLCAPMFIAVLFTIAKCQKQPKCLLVNEWIKKLLVHLYNKILHSRKELLSFATAWVELENIMLNEISQAVKDKYRMISLTSGT